MSMTSFLRASTISNAQQGDYDPVAAEYYDQKLHPTCAAFGYASLKLLEPHLEDVKGKRVADVGAGRSVVLRALQNRAASLASLWVVDQSAEMLAWNIEPVPASVKFAVLPADRLHSIGVSFDVIVASLADPYNTPSFWSSIERSLVPGGRCLFTTPSFEWADAFRSQTANEKLNKALFETRDGGRFYLPSYVISPDDQVALIRQSGLDVRATTSFAVGSLDPVPLKARMLKAEVPIVTLFVVEKSIR